MPEEPWTADYNVNDLGFSVGSASRLSPYDGLTDEQADELQAELEAREAKKVPLGFRGTRSGPPIHWPKVPRFDVPRGAK